MPFGLERLYRTDVNFQSYNFFETLNQYSEAQAPKCDLERCLDLLNGSQWDVLYSYASQAMSVMKCLVNE